VEFLRTRGEWELGTVAMRAAQARRALSSALASRPLQLRCDAIPEAQLLGGFSAAPGSCRPALDSLRQSPAATSRSFSDAAPGDASIQSGVPQSEIQVPGSRAEFPGARSEFTPRLAFAPERAERPAPCFQVLDLHGNTNPGAEEYEVRYRHPVAVVDPVVILSSIGRHSVPDMREAQLLHSAGAPCIPFSGNCGALQC